MKIALFQKGFNYGQDGQGNRLVYHLQGCNLRCPWCANPEGMAPEAPLMATPALLTESCCPHGAAGEGRLDRSVCRRCQDRACLTTCQSAAISCPGWLADVDELADEALRCRPMFFDGGGVTFTGGEPTMQRSALHALLTKLKSAGIHTCIGISLGLKFSGCR
jgi:pyruvate formate lyase activating enzyme